MSQLGIKFLSTVKTILMNTDTGTTVILIRHGEKLEWLHGTPPTAEIVSNYVDDHILSGKGCERAHALVAYFLNRKEMQKIFKDRPLAALVVQESDENGPGRSRRPKETLIPLHDHINYQKKHSEVTFDCFVKKDLDSFISHLKSERFYGKSVIVSWRYTTIHQSHQQMPKILSLLGVKGPEKWPKKR